MSDKKAFHVEISGYFDFEGTILEVSKDHAIKALYEALDALVLPAGLKLNKQVHSAHEVLPQCKLCQDTAAREGSKYCGPCIEQVYKDIAAGFLKPPSPNIPDNK